MKQQHAAFTLVELLVTVALFGILSVALVGFLTNFLQLKFNAETLARMRQEGNSALDQMDFFMRNSVTLPSLCDTSAQTNETIRNNCYSNSTQSLICTNTQIADVNSNGLAMIAKYQIVGINSTGSDNGSLGVRRVKDFTVASQFVDSQLVSLLSTNITTSADLPFKVNNIKFECSKSPFTNGYLVTTSFDLTYQRKSLNANQQEIKEHFSRQTAIRNVATFENIYAN